MKILVTGGTGKVGRELVQALLRRRESVRVLTRNKEATLPDGAELAVGDLLAERFPDVPHFIGKHTVETSLKAFDTPFTVLRPGYFFQNDTGLKPVLTGASLYPPPIGKAGIAVIDVRDIGMHPGGTRILLAKPLQSGAND